MNEVYNNTPAVFLAHGYVGEVLGKTIHGVLMHSRVFKVKALVDRVRGGQDTSRICPGVTVKVPIVECLRDALAEHPQVLILAGAPDSEDLDELKLAIRSGLDIVNPSFLFLENIPQLVELASQYGTRLIDLRNMAVNQRDADGSIVDINAKVVYIMGTDCGVGKRTATYELVQEARRRGINAAFAATGQTGHMLGCDAGIIVDAIPNNYAAGAVEGMIVDLDRRGFELIFLEGQASLMHYSGSGSIVLLHAGNPHAIVLVHDPSRHMHAEMGNSPIFKMCPLHREISIIESLGLPGGNDFKIVALATRGFENLSKLKQTVALPVADARMEGGPAILLDAVLDHLRHAYQWRPYNAARAC